tara:strand:- start:163 stop:363 length:201 start_codon:yes stop_codon:yes gene_type:complete
MIIRALGLLKLRSASMPRRAIVGRDRTGIAEATAGHKKNFLKYYEGRLQRPYGGCIYDGLLQQTAP